MKRVTRYMKIISRFRNKKDACIRRLDCGNCSGSHFSISKTGHSIWIVKCCVCGYGWTYDKSTMKTYRFYG